MVKRVKARYGMFALLPRAIAPIGFALLATPMCGHLHAQGLAAPAQTQLSAREAVTLALANNTEVELARAELMAADGRRQETFGQLDSSFRFNALVSRNRAEVIPAVVRQQTGNRTLLETLDDKFGEQADSLERELRAGPNVVSLECGLGNQILINGRDICESPEVARQRRRLDNLLSTLSASAGGDPDVALDLAALQRDLRATNREFIQTLIDTLRTVSRSSRNARTDLGDVPKTELVKTLMLDFSWFKPMRNGWTFTPQLVLESKADNFSNKPIRGRFGGKGLKLTTRSALGLNLTAPLGRGGRVAVAAEQEAAELRASASANALRFVAGRISFRVLDAYWRLVAADQQLDLVKKQVAARAKLLELGGALLAADEISAGQLIEPNAQAQQASAERIAAEQARADANENLRQLLGLDLSAAPILVTMKDFPSLSAVCLPDATSLVELAERARGDLTNLRFTRLAAERDSVRAHDALRPRLDFTVTVGYLGREENNAILQGIERSLNDELAGPSILFTFSGELDYRNQRAQGVLVSSLELAEQAQLRETETLWQTRRELVETRTRVKNLLLEMRQRQIAVASYRQLNSDTQAALQAGELSPADALTTELQAFDAEAGLISIQQRYLSSIAELGFRSGALMDAKHADQLRLGAEFWPWACP